MKKFLFSATLVIFMLALASPSRAETGYVPAKKIKRGVVNIVTAPLEVIKQPFVALNKESKGLPHKGLQLFGGFLRGPLNTVRRITSGMWDIMTCNMWVDEDPIMQPTYVFSEDEPEEEQ